MKNIRLLSVLLALVLALGLTACAGAPAAAPTPAPSVEPTAQASPTPAASGQPQASPAGQEMTVLTVGASPAPHAEILEVCKPLLAAQGIELKIQIFTDYVLPNTALDQGELDANYFQHYPYLEDFNQKQGTKIVSAAAIHFEPLGVYAGKSDDLANIPEGAQIAVPNDATNEARALQLLEANGIITLKEGAGLQATKLDVVDNPHNVEIVEIEAAQVPRTLTDVNFAVANGNYAIDAKITDKLITTEDKSSEGAQKYANILAVREGEENKPEIQALVKALTSQEVRDFITETYGASVIPVF